MDKKALIIGFGSSGQDAARLLEHLGYQFWIYEDALTFKHLQQISFEELAHREFDEAILSPGISLEHPVCQNLKKRNIPIRGEADFALERLPQRKIAITGTNGKTTVCYLCEHLLKEAGFKAIACGNVSKERSLSKMVLEATPNTILVVELSSFQLETLAHTHFERGVILNITPDHLDRYASMKEYAEAKFKLQDLCTSCAVYEPTYQEFKALVKPSVSVFGGENDEGFTSLNTSLEKFSFQDKMNILAAYFLLEPFKIDLELFKSALRSFKKPSHRFEYVTTIGGIDFIDDSKATNVDAVIQALKSLTRPTILLAGGVDKGYPYSVWAPYLKNVQEVIAFGAARDKIEEDLKSFILCTKQNSMFEALELGYRKARAGYVILLSPGCSSFDEFKDYADRGKQFCEKVLTFQPKETFV